MKKNPTIYYKNEKVNIIEYDDKETIRRAIQDNIDDLCNNMSRIYQDYLDAMKENDILKSRIAKVLAENEMLKKQLDTKPHKKREEVELNDIYAKLKELRKEKATFEKRLDEALDFCQRQYDDLK